MASAVYALLPKQSTVDNCLIYHWLARVFHLLYHRIAMVGPYVCHEKFSHPESVSVE